MSTVKAVQLLPIAVLLAAACGGKETPAPAKAVPLTATKVGATEGFVTPESVLWDAEQQVWFVSNINGSPVAKDSNGFISRLNADGSIDSLHFVLSGRDGVVLNGPKGMALVGDTLWVADQDALRGFNRKTGLPVASVVAEKDPKFLNDVATGPDGTVYVTDMGTVVTANGFEHPGPDRIYALHGRDLTVAAEGAWLRQPNGITWSQALGRFVVVSYGTPVLLGWSPGAATGDSIAYGPGGQDGVEVLNGQVLVTSWADSSVFVMDSAGPRRLIAGVNSPADIGVDQVRSWVAIPLFLENRVEFWKVGE